MKASHFGFVLAILALVVFVSCTNSKKEFVGENFPVMKKNVAYLQDVNNESKALIDSATIENGTFVFKGDSLKSGLYYLTIGDLDRVVVCIGKGKTLLSYNSDINSYILKGTSEDELLNQYYKIHTECIHEIDAVDKEFASANFQKKEDEMTSEQEEKYMALYNRKVAAREKYFTSLQDLVFNSSVSQASLIFLQSQLVYFEAEELQKARALVDAYNGNETLAYRECKKFFAIKDAIATGKQFQDFKVLDTAGNPASLSDIAGKGKIVLVDFWASWCGYCKRAFPELKRIYAKYASKGFEIFGYSLDRDKNKWKAQIATDTLKWIQFVSDASIEKKGEDLYGVTGIPFTVLINKDGKIIGTNLELDEIENILAKELD